MAEIICLGQAVIDCISRGINHDTGRKNVYRADSISLNIGGDAVNEASVLSRLGHSVKLAYGSGRDIAGNIIYEEMKKMGIDLRYADRSEERMTPIANLMVNGDGTRFSYNSTATMLEGYVPDHGIMENEKILSLASLFRAPLDRASVIKDFVKAAKDKEMIVCADTKLATFRKIGPRDIEEIMPLIDYIFPNENEAGFFSGEKEYEKMAEYFRALGVKNVIIKTGKDGCTVKGENESFHLDALPVHAIDSTGAGDNFVAGFISGILRGFSLRKCAQYGTVCASVCVCNQGASGGVRSRKEADDLWEEWYKKE